MKPWSRTTYLVVTALLALAGVLATRAGDFADGTAVVAGLGTAWALQAVSFWKLAGELSRGRNATRAWVGGMALRLGGLGLLAVAAGPAGWARVDLVLSYAVALLVYLPLEALWLWRRQPTGRNAGRCPS